MKFDEKGQRQLVANINAVREETGHTRTRISGSKWTMVRWLWDKAHNPREFRVWFKVEMGW